jgi:hypothetical protein
MTSLETMDIGEDVFQLSYDQFLTEFKEVIILKNTNAL